MNKKIILPGTIVCTDSERRILNNHLIELSGNKIISIRPVNSKDIADYRGEIIHAENLTVIPGFIQTHIHLCQTLFRGLADDLELLDWLQYRIFPFENAHNPGSLRVSAQIGISELLAGGTTTLLDMGTLNHQEVIFEELTRSGMRAFAGKCMIDDNELFPQFKSTTDDELKRTYQLAKEFHNTAGGKIKYGFAPRFVLSCSGKLLMETSRMMEDFEGSIFHTHSSENKSEVEEVRKRTGKENIEYFNSINVLNSHTVLAHCIHVNDKETALLKNTGTRVSHCPSSNLKLGSGIANIPRYIKEGISVSLGADGAPCNNNLNIFKEMHLAALIQKPLHGPTSMNAETVFRLATIEGAKALHIDNETGSIEEGKKADLVFIDLEHLFTSLSDKIENVYSKIVYSASMHDISHVMIDGEWAVKDKQSLLYDNKELYRRGKEELSKLLKRI